MGKYSEAILADQPQTEAPKSKYSSRLLETAPEPEQTRERVDVPFLASVGRGMMDIGQGAKQLALRGGNMVGLVEDETVSDYDKQVSDEMARYEYDQGGSIDAGRVVGQYAATLPLALGSVPATLTGKMMQGSAIGAGTGSLLATGENDSRLFNVGAGAIGGAVAPAVIQGAANTAGFVGQRAKNLIGQVTAKNAQAINAIDDRFAHLPQASRANLKKAARMQIAQSGAVDDEALQRIARAEDFGFTGNLKPTAGQASRDPMVWTRERNMAKLEGIGDDFVTRFKGQDQRFKQIMDDLAKSTGRSVDDVIDSGESIMSAVRGRYDQTQKAVSALYNRARSQYGDVDGIDISGLVGKVDELGDDESLRPITNSVMNILKRRGLVNKEGELTGRTLTVAQAEGIRKQIRNFGGNKSADNWVKSQIIDTLDDDVFNALGDDVFAGARNAAKNRFREFEQKIADRIINGKMGDKAFDNIIKSDSRDILALKKTLDRAPGGQQAWNNLKGQVIDLLNDKATQGMGPDGMFNGTQMKKELNRIGRRKLQAIFGDAETENLFKLADVAVDMTREPGMAAVNYSNSAPALMNYVKAGSKSIPMLGDAIQERSRAVGARRLLDNAVDPIKREAQRRAMVEEALNTTTGQAINRAAPAATALTGLSFFE
jgi:hypothetical protein